MKANFRSASLIDMRLPPLLKERLWKTKMISNAPLMDVLSRLSNAYADTDRDGFDLVQEITQADQDLKRYGPEFFAYRGNQIPPDVVYAAAAKPYIDAAPELFTDLPDSYRRLSDEIDAIAREPARIASRFYSPAAMLCHYLDNRRDLLRYRDNLRNGASVYDPATDAARYNKIVFHAKNNFSSGPGIVADIKKLTQDIDYVINHASEDFAWYVGMGVAENARIDDRNFVYDSIELSGPPRLRETFKRSFGLFEERLPDRYDAFYAVAEKIIAPLSLLCPNFTEEGISGAALYYALAAPAIRESDDPDRTAAGFGPDIELLNELSAHPDIGDDVFTACTVSRAELDAINASMATSALIYHGKRMWGRTIQPYVTVEQVCELETMLKATENLRCDRMPIGNVLDQFRREAAERYNLIAKDYRVLGFEPYLSPGPD